VADRAAAMQAFRSVQANAGSGESARGEDGDPGFD
jgi:hypothetical protein